MDISATNATPLPPHSSVIKCECGSDLLLLAHKAFKISSLASRSGHPEVTMVPAILCFKCHKEIDINE